MSGVWSVEGTGSIRSSKKCEESPQRASVRAFTSISSYSAFCLLATSSYRTSRNDGLHLTGRKGKAMPEKDGVDKAMRGKRGARKLRARTKSSCCNIGNFMSPASGEKARLKYNVAENKPVESRKYS